MAAAVMRSIFLVLALVAAGLFGAVVVFERDVPLPPIAPNVEHRPFVTPPPPPLPTPPPPVIAPCTGTPSTPEWLPDSWPGDDLLAAFTRLYETREFALGYCLAEVQVNEKGTVDSVRVVLPKHADPRVESAIVRAFLRRKFKPAALCGRPIPFTTSVGLFHCPSLIGRGATPHSQRR